MQDIYFSQVSRFEKKDFIVSIAFLRLKNTIATKKIGCLEETRPHLRKPTPKKILYLNPLTHMYSYCIYKGAHDVHGKAINVNESYRLPPQLAECLVTLYPRHHHKFSYKHPKHHSVCGQLPRAPKAPLVASTDPPQAPQWCLGLLWATPHPSDRLRRTKELDEKKISGSVVRFVAGRSSNLNIWFRNNTKPQC